MDACKFNDEYFDYIKNNVSKFECEEKSFQDGFCKFHQKNYSDNELSSALKEKAEKASKDNEPLFYINSLNC